MAKNPTKSHNFSPKKKLLLEALKKTLGNISVASDTIGIDRSTYYDWCHKDPNFKRAIENLQEYYVDFVETKLYERINGKEFIEETIEVDKNQKMKSIKRTKKIVLPDAQLIQFYLKTKGKNRGYIEKQELDINGKFTIDFSENGDIENNTS